MSAADEHAAEFGSLEGQWVPETETMHPTVVRARALAHATLVSTSMKVANIRAAAQSTLLDAHTQAEEVLEASREQADSIREQAQWQAEAIREQARVQADEIAVSILAEAHRNAATITDRALDERDLLLTATLERIADLSDNLMGMADQIIAHAVDPIVARHQLSRFVLALTDMAEQVNRYDEPQNPAAVLEPALRLAA